MKAWVSCCKRNGEQWKYYRLMLEEPEWIEEPEWVRGGYWHGYGMSICARQTEHFLKGETPAPGEVLELKVSPGETFIME